MSEHADIDGVVRAAMAAWKPPPRLSLSEWADRYFHLSAESAAEPGRWRSLPYQRGIMDAFTDPKPPLTILEHLCGEGRGPTQGWTGLAGVVPRLMHPLISDSPSELAWSAARAFSEGKFQMRG
ncbi:hypothetical protein D7Y11_02580 [Corallococcus sp. AB018]|uniref:hypothetical protein n=1 Tax=Corallococcus sp. AB018 TaxID=2316715 RepID=UPI000F88AEA5|nr:hypothetical protein [Corallococcus sp. AB018]RUO94832.1 hypothetical protein D7Y11_02580 [Corallococcus sp. AB018]